MKYLKVTLVVLIAVLAFSTLNQIHSQEDEQVDLECIRRSVTNLDIEPENCEIGEDPVVVFEDRKVCKDQIGATCTNDQRCLKQAYNTGIDIYQCANFVANSIECNNTCSSEEVCFLINAVPIYSLGTAEKEYMCINKDEVDGLLYGGVNLFGVNFGTPTQAVAKIIRTTISVALAIIGGINMWNLMYALWETMINRKAEAYEGAQKTVLSSIFGLFLMIIGFVLVQLFASFFGIPGNIFEFSI